MFKPYRYTFKLYQLFYPWYSKVLEIKPKTLLVNREVTWIKIIISVLVSSIYIYWANFPETAETRESKAFLNPTSTKRDKRKGGREKVIYKQLKGQEARGKMDKDAPPPNLIKYPFFLFSQKEKQSRVNLVRVIGQCSEKER